VYGHAYAVETLLGQRRLQPAARWTSALVLVLLLSAVSLGMSSRSRWLRSSVAGAVLVGFLVLAVLLFALRDRWVNVSAFLVAFWVLLSFHWIYRRLTLAASLRRAVGFDPALMESFRRESRRGGGPVQRDVCILISDVQGYTRLVSQADPAQVAAVMGEFLAGMERAIVAGGGYINKYVGDEIIAVFGFPLSSERREARAVEVGLAMLAELESLKRSWALRNLPLFDGIGIGIDTGTAVFAEVGGRTKSQFDIIGNCINGASRIEGLTREYKRSFLISAEVAQALGGNRELRARFQSLGTVTIRGQGEREVCALVEGNG
jgi:class 3 adenylate cyclase